MLAAQIAIGISSGILIAYIAIRNEASLLRLGAMLAKVIGCLGALVAFYWVTLSAGRPAIEMVAANWFKVTGACFVIVMLTLYAAGGLGLIHLWRIYRPKEDIITDEHRPLSRGETFTILLVSSGNAMLIALVTWPFLEFTALGSWWNQMDALSRTSGYADMFAMASNAVLAIWPWIAVLWIERRRRMRGS